MAKKTPTPTSVAYSVLTPADESLTVSELTLGDGEAAVMLGGLPNGLTLVLSTSAAYALGRELQDAGMAGLDNLGILEARSG